MAVTLSDVWGNAVALTADLTATQLVGARSGHVIHLTDMRPEPAPGGIGMLLHTGTTVGCDSKSSSPCLCFQRHTGKLYSAVERTVTTYSIQALLRIGA